MSENEAPYLGDDGDISTQEELLLEGSLEQEQPEEPNWLDIAERAFNDSTDFLDSGLRNRWERNYAMAQSKHPSGSRYHSDAYKFRSKVFRGKTSAAIRQNMAAAAVALFSTQDVIHVSPENESDERQRIAADASNALINYRLENSIPWFQTCMGAYKEAMTVGAVVSKQYWTFKEEEYFSKNGEQKIRRIEDRPVIDLIPIENIRVHPSANWINPIESSPYVIVMTPMFVQDIQAKKEWIYYSDADLQAVNTDEYDSVRQSREGSRHQDSKAETASVSKHDIIWVHENFIKVEGEDWVYYTVGTSLLLSIPTPVSDYYPHCKRGQRPFVFGVSEIDPHRVYPTGLPERTEGAQLQANKIANQRFDNIELVLNRRHYVRRNAQIDFRALMTSTPGGIVPVSDINVDIKPEIMPDVTQSSYQEQNLVNIDFDEQAGTFSNATVASNRQLNETVGGMQLLSGNANTLTEYQLRIFTETWVEPVVRQIARMVQFYEDAETIMAVTGYENAGNEILNASINVRVSAGFGATDPQKRIQKLAFGLSTVAQVAPDKMLTLDKREILKEVFGALGFRDGERFFPEDGDQQMQQGQQVKQLQQQLQQMQKALQDKQAEAQAKAQAEAQAKVQIAQAEIQGRLENEKLKGSIRLQEARERIAADRQNSLIKIAAANNLKLKELKEKIGIDKEKLAVDKARELNRTADIKNKTAELKYKALTGDQGI